ncbi:MAG TPA: 50S ribosomal protein L2 [Candidatus Woesearchaeota archaeon]|nr:50S ribosomal protein L2 [Candidatus Woesearchaeota archaeon]
MGKRIIAQRRGSGSSLYKYPRFWAKEEAKYIPLEQGTQPFSVTIKEIFDDRSHSAPLVKVALNGRKFAHIAAQGISEGDAVSYYDPNQVRPGNVLMLKQVPEGTSLFNLEGRPGDGGKFVRSGGSSAKLVAKHASHAVVLLPSKKEKVFSLNCRATIGVVAGSGRVDKPFLKAGTKGFYAKYKHKNWPKVSGSAMNAVDHPFGNKRSLRKSKAKPVSRHAPPGRKVGYIAAKRTGKK